MEDAVRYYELEYSGLGSKFKEEVRKAVLRITAYPQAWSIERGECKEVSPSQVSIQIDVLRRRRSYSCHCDCASTSETKLLGR